MEDALEKNFNEERVAALTSIFNDFEIVAKMFQRIREQILAGQGIRGKTLRM